MPNSSTSITFISHKLCLLIGNNSANRPFYAGRLRAPNRAPCVSKRRSVRAFWGWSRCCEARSLASSGPSTGAGVRLVWATAECVKPGKNARNRCWGHGFSLACPRPRTRQSPQLIPVGLAAATAGTTLASYLSRRRTAAAEVSLDLSFYAVCSRAQNTDAPVPCGILARSGVGGAGGGLAGTCRRRATAFSGAVGCNQRLPAPDCFDVFPVATGDHFVRTS